MLGYAILHSDDDGLYATAGYDVPYVVAAGTWEDVSAVEHDEYDGAYPGVRVWTSIDAVGDYMLNEVRNIAELELWHVEAEALCDGSEHETNACYSRIRPLHRVTLDA